MKIKRRYRLVLWLLVVIVINVVVHRYDYKTTPTERIVYNLDEASVGILQQIESPMIITLYKSDNLEPQEQHFADNIQQVLRAYRDAAKVPVHIENINPNESLEVKLEATNSGIKPIDVEGDNNTLRNIFLGLSVQVGNKTEVLPQLMPIMSVEYLISSILRKLVEPNRRKIAVIQGHGEARGVQLSGIARRLLPNYDMDSVVLDRNISLSDYESILIIAPSFKYTDAELNLLDDFLSAGKNILIALDRVEYDDVEQEAYAIDTRLEGWLLHKGILIQQDFIVDNTCSNVRTNGGLVSCPYFPKITNFPKHKATEGIGGIALRFASSIKLIEKEGVAHSVLATTSEVSGKRSLPLQIDLHHEWTKSDYLFPNQVVATVSEGRFGDTDKSAKICVISDADVALSFTNNDPGLLDNHLFIANIIDWLSDATGLATLKQKGVIAEAKEPNFAISAGLKYLNLLLPICIVGLFAGMFFYRRKRHIDKLRTSTF